MATTDYVSEGVRVDSGIDLHTSFTPTLAMSAKNFNTLDLDIRSFREPLKRSIQGVIAPSIQKNFLKGGRPDSWVPLSEATLMIKGRDAASKYPTSDPLLRTGLLYRTMGQYNIWTVTMVQAAILNLPDKIWYGALHQAGYGAATAADVAGDTSEGFMSMIEGVIGGGHRAHIPARPFAMVQDEDLDAIEVIWEIWLNERIIARLGL
jgi:phage gpG-like protein